MNTAKELLAPLEWMQLLAQAPSFWSLPKGDGRPVMLAPGYMTSQWSMRPLKVFLQKLGYLVVDWGLGRNEGKVERDVERMAEQVRHCQRSLGIDDPFTLIGWSLGGVVCREVARLHPELVREVITLGTPITGGPKYTVVGKEYARRENLDMDAFEDYVLEKNMQGLTQPVTSIYSSTDGVVSWEASLDVYNEQAQNIEVKASHFGMGVNAKVWRVIAHVLNGQAQAN